MADHGADAAVQFFVTHLTVVKTAARKSSHDINAVCLRTVEAVDSVRRLYPFCLVYRFGVFFDALGDPESSDRFQSVPVVSALLLRREAELLAAVFSAGWSDWSSELSVVSVVSVVSVLVAGSVLPAVAGSQTADREYYCNSFCQHFFTHSHYLPF